MEYQTEIKLSYGKDGVHMPDHDRLVMSYMVGDYLAVHESVDDDDMWTISHAPTGFAVRSRIPDKRTAIDWAHEIMDMMNWDFSAPEDAVKQEGFEEVVGLLYPDRQRKPDPIAESFKTEWVKPENPSKLEMLLYIEGFNSELEFMETFICDTLCPGICMNEGCDYTTMYEQDQNGGWCEVCDTATVRSGMLLMGMI